MSKLHFVVHTFCLVILSAAW